MNPKKRVLIEVLLVQAGNTLSDLALDFGEASPTRGDHSYAEDDGSELESSYLTSRRRCHQPRIKAFLTSTGTLCNV